ncbi:hypothetical protein [Psychroflexus aestuariivivens]|uniref:hypothetical protein n=1 Tax=Psychroflexus aestuariivivens TaxID=1795040 RepID=UPI000FD87934|nr:hypothetical protein [Psychroflexus aestuariivivens]
MVSFQKKKESVIKQFQTGKDKELRFSVVFNKISNLLHSRSKEYIKEKNLETIFKIFLEKRNNYLGDTLRQIELVLENEIKDYFESNNVKTSFEKLIENIGTAHALTNISINADNNSNVYQYMYDFNDYKEFTLQNIKSKYPNLEKN